jgi:hypothetical protein
VEQEAQALILLPAAQEEAGIQVLAVTVRAVAAAAEVLILMEGMEVQALILIILPEQLVRAAEVAEAPSMEHRTNMVEAVVYMVAAAEAAERAVHRATKVEPVLMD